MFKSLSKKARTNKGMTMAEMLITVAIIVVLAGVAFIAIFSYQRNMALFERDKIAKEIFIAAQNHLTVAKGQDYPGCSSDFSEKNDSSTADGDAKYAGTREEGKIDPSDTKEEPYYYIIVNSGNLYKNPSSNGYYMLNSMLPDGSVEDTVRIGGDYIIRYQPKTGRILDVFYTTAPPENYSLDGGFTPTVFDDLMRDHSKDKRKNYGSNDAVVGYYGGADLTSLGCEINTPDIDIENSDKLSAKVYWEPNSELVSGLNLNSDIKMTIAIKGNQSGAEASDLMPKTKGVAGGLNGASAPSGLTNPLGAANRLSASNVLTNLGVVPLNAIRNTLLGAGDDTEKANLFDTYVLDDITTQKEHFATKINKLVTDAGGTTKFIPGEDITVKIIIQSTEYLGMAESETVLTNSLFDSISNGKSKEDDSDYKYKDTSKSTITISDTSIAPSTTTTDNAPDTAYISCIRHLENLDDTVSNFDAYDDTNKLKIGKAIQKKDLTWSTAKYSTIRYGNSVTGNLEFDATNNTNGKFKAVLMKDNFAYNGKKHSIEGVDVEHSGNAGLFGSAKNGSIKNLKLIDFSVKSTAADDTGNAGMLAGKLDGTTVTNVIGITESDDKVTNQVVTGKNAGGLVGTMTGAKIEYSAAAVRVNGSSNAGGLVGAASGTSEINGCYSGGHTKEGSYTKLKDSNDTIMYDVASAQTAGGLVGNFSGSKIENSYSTCSVNGVGTAGGFVGTSTGTITDSYCTGLVNNSADADNKHAFIGSGTASSSNKYYAIINTTGTGKDLKEMEPGGGTDNNGANKVKAFDENTQTFANFAQAGIKSYPYDKGQQGLKGKFIFKVIPDSSNYFVHEHYGDWPQPEVFVINN